MHVVETREMTMAFKIARPTRGAGSHYLFSFIREGDAGLVSRAAARSADRDLGCHLRLAQIDYAFHSLSSRALFLSLRRDTNVQMDTYLVLFIP